MPHPSCRHTLPTFFGVVHPPRRCATFPTFPGRYATPAPCRPISFPTAQPPPVPDPWSPRHPDQLPTAPPRPSHSPAWPDPIQILPFQRKPQPPPDPHHDSASAASTFSFRPPLPPHRPLPSAAASYPHVAAFPRAVASGIRSSLVAAGWHRHHMMQGARVTDGLPLLDPLQQVPLPPLPSDELSCIPSPHVSCLEGGRGSRCSSIGGVVRWVRLAARRERACSSFAHLQCGLPGSTTTSCSSPAKDSDQQKILHRPARDAAHQGGDVQGLVGEEAGARPRPREAGRWRGFGWSWRQRKDDREELRRA